MILFRAVETCLPLLRSLPIGAALINNSGQEGILALNNLYPLKKFRDYGTVSDASKEANSMLKLTESG